ncbi:hypothetical protein CsSME_00049619 [Camellia sinensis var. sinensis]
MGISEIDCRVGTLVWVQRKNGSWWPGRVVELTEFSPSHLTHRRACTPVKLLGREDSSVDWYNLEKSKRIKAFRCGEFDDCIERAESSHANFSKKIVKYARREDAILHALELEKQEVQRKHKAAGSFLTQKEADVFTYQLSQIIAGSAQLFVPNHCRFQPQNLKCVNVLSNLVQLKTTTLPDQWNLIHLKVILKVQIEFKGKHNFQMLLSLCQLNQVIQGSMMGNLET